jgi:MFS family permease
MSLGIFLILVDNTIVNTALPAISRDLGASTSILQWVVDSYTLVLAGLLLLGGTIGDRFGRRQWMAIGMSVFGVAAVGAAFSTNADSWSAVFLMHVPIVALALAGLFFVVPNSRDSRKRSLDVPGGLLATGGLLALGYGIIQGAEAGWTSPQIVGAFVAAVALLAAFGLVETRTKEPMLPLQFFRQKDFTGGVIIIGLIFFAMLVTFFFLTQYLQLVQGRSAFEAGSMIVIMAVGMMIGAPIAGALVKRVGPRILITGSVLPMIVGLLLLLNLEANSSTLQIAASLVVFGVGAGLGLAPLTDTVMAAVPVNDAGVGSAVNDVSRELGAAFGIAIVGSLVNSIYRGNVEEALSGSVPPSAIEAAKEGIGVAAISSESLPPDVAAQVMSAANLAFVDAITSGFIFSIAIFVLAAIVAVTLLPNKMRETQAELDDGSDSADRPRITLPAPQAVPVPVTVESSPVALNAPNRQSLFH